MLRTISVNSQSEGRVAVDHAGVGMDGVEVFQWIRGAQHASVCPIDFAFFISYVREHLIRRLIQK
uniref:Uncharacterized protein n=1 Tax=Plectus sambesii TaxID=2011161 RepID=A0A914VFW4_9BILA